MWLTLLFFWSFIGVLVAAGLFDDYDAGDSGKKYNKYQKAFIIFCLGPFTWFFILLFLAFAGVSMGFQSIMDYLGTLEKPEE